MAPSISFPEVEEHVLSDIYNVSRSPLVGGAALESLLAFYASLVRADKQIATHVVPSLVLAADKGQVSKGSGVGSTNVKADVSFGNVARCVAIVVKTDQGVAAGTIAEYSKHVKVGLIFFLV